MRFWIIFHISQLWKDIEICRAIINLKNYCTGLFAFSRFYPRPWNVAREFSHYLSCIFQGFPFCYCVFLFHFSIKEKDIKSTLFYAKNTYSYFCHSIKMITVECTENMAKSTKLFWQITTRKDKFYLAKVQISK